MKKRFKLIQCHIFGYLNVIFKFSILKQNFNFCIKFKAFLPKMIEKNHGHLVTIASMAGKFGSAGLFDYCWLLFQNQEPDKDQEYTGLLHLASILWSWSGSGCKSIMKLMIIIHKSFLF